MDLIYKPKVTVVIPTYNEVENIKTLCEEIFKYLPACQIIIVDDDSTDGTKEVISGLANLNPKIKFFIRSVRPRSYSQSYINGFALALGGGADYIIQMDADFSHHPEYLPEIINSLSNNDLVIGSRYVKGGGVKNWSFWRSFLSQCGSFFASKAAATPIRDLTGGFVGWRRGLLSAIGFEKINTSGFVFQVEIKRQAHKIGARIKEVPIVFQNRKNGFSKMNGKIITEALAYCFNIRKSRWGK